MINKVCTIVNWRRGRKRKHHNANRKGRDLDESMAPIPIAAVLNTRIPISLPVSADILTPFASLAKRLPADLDAVHSRLLAVLKRQQNPEIIPTTYGSINSGPAPGTVVGIVLGSVGGFLLVLWLIYTCAQFGNPGGSGSSYTESVVVRERRKSHGSRSSRRMSETVEVRRERSPVRIVRQPERVERIVVEESRETRRERSRGGSDEVVVIEEHSPPRRSKSKREKEERRESGYRTVDPLAYGGVVGGRKERRGSGR